MDEAVPVTGRLGENALCVDKRLLQMIEKSGDWCDIAENIGSTEWCCGVMGKRTSSRKGIIASKVLLSLTSERVK